MTSGDRVSRADAEAAETAARQAIDADGDDWHGYAALADALVAQKRFLADLVARQRMPEAVVAARRAVALAPDKAEARLTLADALFALVPRRIGNRAAAYAEIDQAELLGADAEDLAKRRKQPPTVGQEILTLMVIPIFTMFGVASAGGTVGRAIAWPAMILLIVTRNIAKLRPKGQSLRGRLAAKRALSRRRMPTDEQVLVKAPGAAAVLAILVLPGAGLSIPGADETAPSLPAALALLGCIPVVVLSAWIGIDHWLRPGTVIRMLRHDVFSICSVAVTLLLAPTSPLMVVRKVQSPGLWFTMYLVQMAWLVGNFIVGFRIVSQRKKKAAALSA
jgi:hypothetical protein